MTAKIEWEGKFSQTKKKQIVSWLREYGASKNLPPMNDPIADAIGYLMEKWKVR